MLSNGTWQPTYKVGTRGCWWKLCCASRSLCLECRPVRSRRCCCLVLRRPVTLEILKVSARIRPTISVRKPPLDKKKKKNVVERPVRRRTTNALFSSTFSFSCFLQEWQQTNHMPPSNPVHAFSCLTTVYVVSSFTASLKSPLWSSAYSLSSPLHDQLNLASRLLSPKHCCSLCLLFSPPYIFSFSFFFKHTVSFLLGDTAHIVTSGLIVQNQTP